MARGDADSEYEVLTTPAGEELLSEVARVPSPGPSELARWRRVASPELVTAAVRLSTTRRRAASKFSRAAEMWLEPVGFEQATAELVAKAKARRFGSNLVVDFCAGIGGDSLALAAEGKVIAVDSDPGMCRRIAWNAEVYGVGGNLLPVQSKAETLPLPTGAFVHVDPDRRAGDSKKGRARLLQDYVPSLEFLGSLPNRSPGGAVKLGPASDFEESPEFSAWEIEIVSLGGECKEATAWFGELATCRRRATCLPQGATWTEKDGPGGRSAPSREVSRWIYDPDPSLSRTRLLDSFVLAHDLARVAPTIDFLTSEAFVTSPFLASYEVIETAPVDRKALRRLIARHQVGVLDIKPRGGLNVKPEELRKELKLEGPNRATLFLWGGHVPSQAVLARRWAGEDDALKP